MNGRVLVLRPEPGAGETAARARALGLAPIIAPIFTVRPLAWAPPDAAAFDAVMLTSANAARHAGGGLASFRDLPCYAVGEATAAAARAAGFGDIRTGPADGAALVARMVEDGIAAAFHPSGADRIELAAPGIRLVPAPVYVSEAVDRLPEAAITGLRDGSWALLHSPRAAALFARLAGDARAEIAIAAISPAAAAAAGEGWRKVATAPRPRDEALLELVAKLCQNEAG